MGVFASATTGPITRAAAMAGKNRPGRARARHSDQMLTTGSMMPNTMLPTWARSLSGHASSQTGGRQTMGNPLVSAAQPAPRILALATPLPFLERPP